MFLEFVHEPHKITRLRCAADIPQVACRLGNVGLGVFGCQNLEQDCIEHGK